MALPNNKHGGRRSYQPGRPRKALDDRTPRHDGKLAAWLPIEDMALAQRLMLHFPEARNIDELCGLALRRLAATTDD